MVTSPQRSVQKIVPFGDTAIGTVHHGTATHQVHFALVSGKSHVPDYCTTDLDPTGNDGRPKYIPLAHDLLVIGTDGGSDRLSRAASHPKWSPLVGPQNDLSGWARRANTGNE